MTCLSPCGAPAESTECGPQFAALPASGNGDLSRVSPEHAASRHVPVLLEAALVALAPHDSAVYVDATFGGGGYSAALLAAADCSVIAIDRDPAAL